MGLFIPLTLVIGYLLGNLNGAVWVSHLLKDDVRTHGSGNAGLTNFVRSYGAHYALLVVAVDALKAVALPAVEVHISDVDNREPFRQISYPAMACIHTIKGHGLEGYREAVLFLKDYLNR